ncbi:MAG: beta/gamma crystallin-related protein [Acidobacteriota bacterium]
MNTYRPENNAFNAAKPLRFAAFLVLVATVVSAPLWSQRRQIQRGQGGGPPIAALEIHVEDMSTGDIIAKISPKDTLEVVAGQRLRLRMVGLPAGNVRAPRYPSTRFWMERQVRQVNVERINEQVGAIIVNTVRPHTGPGAAPILFEVVDPIQIDARQKTGRVYLKVVPARAAAPAPDQEVVRERERRGVTLFEDAGFRGRSYTVYSDRNDLRGTPIGNDRATSIRVDPGCEAIVYEDIEYRGRSAVIRADAAAIDDFGIGNDTLSSIRVVCGRDRDQRGVTLFDGVDFSGNYEFFAADDAGLGDNVIGNDRARSVQVDRGCVAVLYRDANFRGGSTEVARDLATLNGTPVGNDGATSIRVDCRGR